MIRGISFLEWCRTMKLGFGRDQPSFAVLWLWTKSGLCSGRCPAGVWRPGCRDSGWQWCAMEYVPIGSAPSSLTSIAARPRSRCR